ncbi:hypothetical protein B0O80DRAFT_78792 [Mortierella sp. GBAus27b]|nr:hypothetical protein B0O80DRAFT_78792 [Mortierella sp. GBAus27b]
MAPLHGGPQVSGTPPTGLASRPSYCPLSPVLLSMLPCALIIIRTSMFLGAIPTRPLFSFFPLGLHATTPNADSFSLSPFLLFLPHILKQHPPLLLLPFHQASSIRSPSNMVLYGFKHMALACLLLECSMLAAGKIIVSGPDAHTVWTPGETYRINVQDDYGDKAVQRWQVDLMVLGGECDGICLHDGVVAEISKGHSTQSVLQFQVPVDLVQHGKFSNAGSAPIYISETFTIERASKAGKERSRLRQRDMVETGARKSENAAPYVLPTGMVLGLSGIFAVLMI